MKKLLAIVLAFTLILALAACGKTETSTTPETTVTPEPTEAPETETTTAEPASEPTVETWYGLSRGLELTLALSSDGSYTLTTGPSVILSDSEGSEKDSSASLQNDMKVGTWDLKDGLIALDGEKEGSLFKVNGLLAWPALGLYLSTEKPEYGAYVPADVIMDGVTAELFNGYWQSLYVDADGTILSADDLGDKTDIFIEAPRAALGGPLFGDVTVDMTYADGALTWTAENVSVKLQLQSDGLLRMTLTAPDSNMTLYLLPVYVEGISPEPAE